MSLAPSRWLLWLLAIVAVAVASDNLGRPLANPDEGRYSEISREMAASGDWVTPRLNGIKYFEKPPLQYWAGALAFTLLPLNEYSARLYVALCGLATLLLLAFTARRLGAQGSGAAALVALASSPYFMALGGIVTLDMGLTLWTTLTFCAHVIAEHSATPPDSRRRWMLLAWAAMALAVLSKGLVGLVIPAAAIGLHCLARLDFAPLARLEWMRGSVLFLAIAAPWFVAVSLANPEFPEFFFIHEHFQRFLSTAHRREEPWWYFLPIFAAGFLPWMFALPSAIARGWRAPAAPGTVAPLRLAILWAFFVVAFFSLSGSKLPAYILPAFPPIALVLGRYLADAPPRKLALQAAPVAVVALVLLAAAWRLPETAREPWTRLLYAEARPWALAAALVLLATALLASLTLWRGRRWYALVLAAIGTALVVDCVEDAFEVLAPRQSGMEVAQKMALHATARARLYSVKHYEQTVPFYLGRTLMLVEYGDEFELGLKSQPELHIRSLADFPAHWLRPGDALAIMHPDTYHALRAQALPMQLLHEDPKRVLVRKP
jgi:4-amino-4-deoxy-L-arabinose transferase-like glycosyltransferase